MTYGIKSTLNPIAGDKIVATALDGVVYTENNRVHVKGNTRHYVYKYDGSPVGWYARNIKTNDDVYLGDGACPTIELESVDIKDDATWGEIVQPDADDADDDAVPDTSEE